MSQKMTAFVAIKRFANGLAVFAYLPNINVQLPDGWEWAIIDGEVDTMDVTEVGWYDQSLEDKCRMMSASVGLMF